VRSHPEPDNPTRLNCMVGQLQSRALSGRAFDLVDEAVDNAIHDEFVGLDTSSVARCDEEGPGAGSDIVQMYGEPLALQDDATQLPPVGRKATVVDTTSAT
jgi:hypothetical protein